VSKIASLKISVALLLALLALVFYGTLYQAEHGLYLAQEKVFKHPLAIALISMLFINLIFGLIYRFRYKTNNIGLIVAHFGFVVLLISGFLNLNFSDENFIEIYEAESSNKLQSYYDWQLVFNSNNQKQIYDLKKINHTEDFEIIKIYENAQIFDTPFAGQIFKELPSNKDFEKNIKAIKINYKGNEIILDGNDHNYIETKDFNSFKLERKNSKLPFSIKLISTSRELYPGTQIAKSYESKIAVIEEDLEREVLISMNKPFRKGLYTIYQANYGMDEDGQEFAVFAVVKNLAYLLPYISVIISSLGLCVHFILKFMRRRGNEN
jgi:cytochrome c biogenesis protein ResB